MRGGPHARHSPRRCSPVAPRRDSPRTGPGRASLSRDTPRRSGGRRRVAARAARLDCPADGPVDERREAARWPGCGGCIRSRPSTCAAGSPGGPSWPAGVGRGSLLRLVSDGQIARPTRGVFCRPELTRHARLCGAICASRPADLRGRRRRLGLDTCQRRERLPRPRRRPTPARNPACPAHRWGLAGHGPGRRDLRRAARLRPVPAHADAVVVIDSASARGRVDRRRLAGRARLGRWPVGSPRVLALADPQLSRSSSRWPGRCSWPAGDHRAQPVRCTSTTSAGSTSWSTVAGRRAGRLGVPPGRSSTRIAVAMPSSAAGLRGVRFTYGDLIRRRTGWSTVVREMLDRGRPPFGPAGRAGQSDSVGRATRRGDGRVSRRVARQR